MSKINIEFKDRIVEFPNRYSLTDNGDGTYTLTPFPGEITEEGTPVNAANLNEMCNAINSALLQSITFTKSGVWVCPQGVSTVDVWVVGGGGGGASNRQDGSGGGGGTGGECNLFTVPVTAGQTYEVIVGNGGSSGATGGYSQFGSSTYRSNGGAGGSENTIFGGGCAGGPLSSTKDGVGGVPESINPYNIIPYAAGGGAGHSSVGGDGGICGGGGGGGNTGGNGGIGYNGLQSGNNGDSSSTSASGGRAGDNTGAGGGGAWSTGINLAFGGSGGSGIVIIYYRQILND